MSIKKRCYILILICVVLILTINSYKGKIYAGEINIMPTGLLLRLELPYYARETLYANGNLYVSCLKYFIRFNDIDEAIAKYKYEDIEDDHNARNGLRIPYDILLEDIEDPLSRGIYGLGKGINGRILVTNHTQNKIFVLLNGDIIKTFSLSIPSGENAYYIYYGKKYDYSTPGPADVAQASNGNIYVTDGCNHRVVIFNKYYEEIGILGEGTEYAVNLYTSYIAIDSKDNIFINKGNYIRKFDRNGKFIKEFIVCNRYLCHVQGLYVDGKDRIFVVGSAMNAPEGIDSNIHVYDENGNRLFVLSNELIGNWIPHERVKIKPWHKIKRGI